jgi:Putative effector of murein hydrolase
MSTLSQLTSLTWTALAEKPVLETGATVFAFLAATRISRLGGNHPLLNPTLLAIILISLGLEASHIPYDVYLRGADAIHFMLGPRWCCWQYLYFVRGPLSAPPRV